MSDIDVSGTALLKEFEREAGVSLTNARREAGAFGLTDKPRKPRSKKSKRSKEKKSTVTSSTGSGAASAVVTDAKPRKKSKPQTKKSKARAKAEGKVIPKTAPGKTKSKKKSTDADAKPAAPMLLPGDVDVTKLAMPGNIGRSSGGAWYELLNKLTASTSTTKSMTSDPILSSQWHRKATELLAKEVSRYAEKQAASGQSKERWLKTVMTSGTLSDKVSAMTLVIQESPLHTMDKLSAMMTMAQKKGRREANLACTALADLFANTLLPGNRKLKYFQQQNPSVLGQNAPQMLVLWMFEHELKTKFGEFVEVLRTGSMDGMEYFKSMALKCSYELLASQPEQEAVLLSILVNKLGDPDRKIASKAVYLLGQLVEKHRAMQPVIVREVHQLVARPNVTGKARYYAVLFLNQLVLSDAMPEVAGMLVGIYFGLFEEVVQQEKQEQSKLLSALLTGVNRAFPFAKNIDGDEYKKQIDTLFRIVHTGSFATSIQALTLLFQVMSTSRTLSDRFYRALYAKLLDPQLLSTSKHALFLNLIFRALKSDISAPRVKAIVKRLLQMLLQGPAHLVAGGLWLVSELVKSRTDLVDAFELGDPKLTTAGDATAYNSGSEDEEESEADEGDDEEHKQESSSEAESEEAEDNEEMTAEREKALAMLDGLVDDDEPSSKPSKPHTSNLNEGEAKPDDGNTPYDGHVREPLAAHAGTAPWWEVCTALHHYHPSVKSFAQSLLQAPHNVQYTGDPISDFTLMAFLDRFVYKNPKKKHLIASGAVKSEYDDETALSYAIASEKITEEQARAIRKAHGGSAMQRSGSREAFAHVAQPVNTKQFLASAKSGVREDELFFHKYFSTKQQTEEAESKQQAKKAGTGEEAESEDDEAMSQGEETDGEEEFAQQLAEQLMARHAAGPGKADVDGDFDDQDFDYSSDEGDSGSGSEGEADEAPELEQDDADSSADDGDALDDDEGTMAQFMQGGDSDEDEDEDVDMEAGIEAFIKAEAPDDEAVANSKLSRMTGGAGASIFAAAEDYDDALETDEDNPDLDDGRDEDSDQDVAPLVDFVKQPSKPQSSKSSESSKSSKSNKAGKPSTKKSKAHKDSKKQASKPGAAKKSSPKQPAPTTPTSSKKSKRQNSKSSSSAKRQKQK